MLPGGDGLARRGELAAACGNAHRVGVAAIGREARVANAAIPLTRPENDGPRAIAENNASGTILVVDNTRHRIGADDDDL